MPDWEAVLNLTEEDLEALEQIESFVTLAGATIVETRTDATGKKAIYFIMPEGSATAFVEKIGGKILLTLRVEADSAEILVEGFKKKYPEAEVREVSG